MVNGRCGTVGRVPDIEAESLRIHSCHRIFDVLCAACAGGDVEKREVGHTAFVLDIICKHILIR